MNHRGVRLEHLRKGWGQLDFNDLGPGFFQSLGGFMKRFLDVRVCQIPLKGFAQAHRGSLIHGNGFFWDQQIRVARHFCAKESHVADISGHQANRVTGIGIGPDPALGYQVVGGFVARHPTVAAGANGRAHGLCAGRKADHVGGNGRRRTGGRPTRGVVQLARVARAIGGESGQLGGDGFAQHHATRLAQGGNTGRILHRLMPCKNLRAPLCGHVMGIKHVFDAHRQAVHGPLNGLAV